MPLTAASGSAMGCGSQFGSGAARRGAAGTRRSAVRRGGGAEALVDVVLDGARQADADVGVFALAGAVDDAAHHRDLQVLDPGVAALPHRHLRAQEVVDLLGELLERGAGRAAAAGA